MKRLAWAIIGALFVIYCIVVYGWWQEGNRNQNRVELDHGITAGTPTNRLH